MEKDIILEDVVDEEYGYWVGTMQEGFSHGEPVYGEWQCSNCGVAVYGCDVPQTHKYCFRCGKKMIVKLGV